MEVADFTVDKEKNIKADWSTDTEKGTNTVGTSLISVTLRNISDNPVRLTQTQFKFDHISGQECVLGGGDGRIAGRYDIKVPDSAKSPISVTRKMGWDLPPHKQETISYTVGPEHSAAGSLAWIYRFTIFITSDKGEIELPTVAHAASSDLVDVTIGNAELVFSPDSEYRSRQPCFKDEAKIVDDIIDSTKHTSPELRKLNKGLAAFVP
ncbi:hypothetical protein ACLVWQ_11525 [Streptomyces sp. CWNU-52B]|uniref:hypothetical protein n=1 Tax=unclassified Streptomyces TaxID=2593676 RepID=UPI0039C26589